MNRLILEHGIPVTIRHPGIFSRGSSTQGPPGGVDAIILLAATAVAVWVLGAFVFIYFWP